MIASYCSSIGEQRRNSQEQPEAPPGDTGGNANKTPLKGFVEDPGMKIGVSEAMPREHLTQEALEKLGTPAGGDVDPDMTAIFKVDINRFTISVANLFIYLTLAGAGN